MNNKILPYSFAVIILFVSSDKIFSQGDSLVFHPVNNAVLNSFDIRKIAVAKDGKLWLSTDNGVASFNGYDVRFYGRGDDGKGKMAHKSISRCFFDANDNLYALIAGGGIFYLHTRTGKVEALNIHIDSEDSSGFFFPVPYTQMLIDSGFLWIGRSNMGFISYDISTHKTTAYRVYDPKNKYNNTVTSLGRDLKNDEIIWLGTSNGIWSFNKKTHELKKNFHCINIKDSSSTDADILKINISNKDSIWFTASERGVGCYDIKSGNYTIYPCVQEIKKRKTNSFEIVYFQTKNKDEFFIGTHYQLPGIFNIRTHQYIFETKISEEFPGVNINHIVADSSGNLWCLIFGRLYFANVKRNSFTTLLLHDISMGSKLTNVFRNIIWDAKSKYYYVVFDKSDALFVLDSNKQYVKSIPIVSYINHKEEIRETNIYDIVQDAKGRLWSCGSFLSMYDSLSKKMVPASGILHNPACSNQTLQNLAARGNRLYLQPSDYYHRKFYRINTNNFICDSFAVPETIINNNPPKSDGEKKIDELLVDKHEKYAYMGLNNSLIQINLQTTKARTVTSYSAGYFDHFVNMFWYALDDYDRLWVCTIHGVEIYEEETLELVKTIPIDDGTYYSNICNADGKGIMCILYSRGVILFDYKNSRRYNLSIVDGLIHLNNSCLAFANNNLFVGSELDALQYLPLSSATDEHKERAPYIAGIQVTGKPYYTDTIPEYLHSITLPHDKNAITLSFSCTEFQQATRLTYRYKLTEIDEFWRYANYTDNNISYNNLPPGDYTFYTRVLNADNKWSKAYATFRILILPAWWQTEWFKILSAFIAIAIVWVFIIWRIETVRKQEQLRNLHERELLELEAKALRAQMNPHFIFNCMNSIKSLIQQKDEDKAINYLTTFSKLIRTIFQNSDKREISLYDEIETCRLYTQLESMRFGNKFSYHFVIDETIDLKSMKVPALILQPFIENAIWHGIMPKEEVGYVNVTVKKENENVCCIITDNGIGRDMSKQNKFQGDTAIHQSKGVHLTQSRLDLDNLLNERNASLEIIDKKNEDGKSAGTTVILKFKEY